MPNEWLWFRASSLQQRAECCGVFGGSNTEFINYYAKLALEKIEHSANTHLWSSLNERVERNILVEQYLLAACIEHYKNFSGNSNQSLDIHYLFNSMDDAFDPRKAAEAGYTHLVTDTKKNKALANDLERRVEKDYPDAFEKCLRYEEKCNYSA